MFPHWPCVWLTKRQTCSWNKGLNLAREIKIINTFRRALICVLCSYALFVESIVCSVSVLGYLRCTGSYTADVLSCLISKTYLYTFITARHYGAGKKEHVCASLLKWNRKFAIYRGVLKWTSLPLYLSQQKAQQPVLGSNRDWHSF